MVTILEQLQSYWFFLNIKNRGLEANFFNLQKIIHLQCYISALNQKQKNFMKRMVVKKVYNLT